MSIALPWVLWLAVLLFVFGVFGVVTRRDGFVVLLSLQMMLGACALAFAGCSRSLADATGRAMVLVLFAIAVSQAAVSLALFAVSGGRKGPPSSGSPSPPER